MPNYRVCVFMATAKRSTLQELVGALTRTSHASAIQSGSDFASASGNKCQAFLSVDEEGLLRLRALRLSRINDLWWVVRTARKVVVESDISTITVGQTVTDLQVVTAMAGTYSVSSPSAIAYNDAPITVFGEEATIRAQGGASAGTPTHEGNVYVDQSSPISDVLALAIAQIGGSWYGSGVVHTGFDGYGVYEFTVANRCDQFDAPMVFAAWGYAPTQAEPKQEIDWEWSPNLVALNQSGHNTQRVLWTYVNSQLISHVASLSIGSGYFKRYRVAWLPGSITFEIFADGATTPEWSSVSTDVSYTPNEFTWRWTSWIYQYASAVRPTNDKRIAFFGYRYTPA